MGQFSLIGGLIGNNAAKDDRRAAIDAISEAVGAIQGIELPKIEEMRIALQTLESQGMLTPELEAEILQDPTKLLEISQDPQFKETQKEYLSELRRIGELGITPEERAELNKRRLETLRDVNAKDQQILQNMAARGQVTPGMELAQRLQASQAGAERQMQESDNLQAMAYRRALDAMSSGANLAGQMDQTDYQKQLDLARAKDAINQFNVANRTGTQQRNVGSKNQAQATNLSEKQRIADTNVSLKNQQEIHNKNLYQKNFENALAKGQALLGAKTKQSEALKAKGDSTAQMWTGIGEGIDETSESVAKAIMMSDKNAKKNIKSATKEIGKFLDSLEGSLYEYKNKKEGQGEQVSPMAQNVEKTKMGQQMVQEGQEGKVIDYGKGFGAMAASLGELHRRLKELEKNK